MELLKKEKMLTHSPSKCCNQKDDYGSIEASNHILQLLISKYEHHKLAH